MGVNVDKIDLDIFIVYRKPYGTTQKSFWNKLGKLGSSKKNTIIAGDFNSHHSLELCEY